MRLYRKVGFSMSRTGRVLLPDAGDGPSVPPNDFQAALDTLRGVVDDAFLRELEETAL